MPPSWQWDGSPTRLDAHEAGFRSGFEKKFAADLAARGVAFEYEQASVPYTIEHEWVLDWTITKRSGEKLLVETKGVFAPEDRRKVEAALKQNPTLDIRIVFQNANNKLYRGSKTTYAQWCNKRGIAWAQGSLPEEWLK